MISKLNTLLALSSLATVSLSAQTITYVDAVSGGSGNTFATGGSLSDTSWISPSTDISADDDQWKLRTATTNDDTIFQARGDNIPELTTQITGLADGTYDLWVFFWDTNSSGNTWGIDAGLTSGSLTTYSFDGAGDTLSSVDAGTLTFSGSVLTSNGGLTLYGVNLGQQTIAGGSALEVFVGHSTGDRSQDRTWYDGVGYTAVVIPEPASYAAIFGAVALAGMIVMRRRKK